LQLLVGSGQPWFVVDNSNKGENVRQGAGYYGGLRGEEMNISQTISNRKLPGKKTLGIFTEIDLK
jgi:hypothetical protein